MMDWNTLKHAQSHPTPRLNVVSQLDSNRTLDACTEYIRGTGCCHTNNTVEQRQSAVALIHSFACERSHMLKCAWIQSLLTKSMDHPKNCAIKLDTISLHVTLSLQKKRDWRAFALKICMLISCWIQINSIARLF